MARPLALLLFLTLWGAGCGGDEAVKRGDLGAVATPPDRSAYLCREEKDLAAALSTLRHPKADDGGGKALQRMGFFVRGGTPVKVLDERGEPHYVFQIEILDGELKGARGWLPRHLVRKATTSWKGR